MIADTYLEEKEAQKSSDSRKKIIEAAFREFGERGYDGASTNQICQVAGISKGLLYHYFKSKENLFLSVCDSCIRDMEQEMSREIGANEMVDLNVLFDFYRKQADFFLSHPHHYHILSQILSTSCEAVESYIAEKHKKYREQASVVLRLFLSRSPVRAGVDKELVLELLLELIGNLQSRYMDSIYQQHIPLQVAQPLMEKQLRALIDIILNGILAPEKKEGMA